MKHLAWIFGIYLGLSACRSSYDESQHKTEIKANSKSTPTTPQVDTTPPSTGATNNPSGSGTGTVTVPSSTGTVSSGSNPLPGADPSSIMAQHNGSPEELKMYNCKGTALITDTGLDRNRDGILQDSEIQETRIDCTEVVPGGN